jgi:hypothetical protein
MGAAQTQRMETSTSTDPAEDKEREESEKLREIRV